MVQVPLTQVCLLWLGGSLLAGVQTYAQEPCFHCFACHVCSMCSFQCSAQHPVLHDASCLSAYVYQNHCWDTHQSQWEMKLLSTLQVSALRVEWQLMMLWVAETFIWKKIHRLQRGVCVKALRKIKGESDMASRHCPLVFVSEDGY